MSSKKGDFLTDIFENLGQEFTKISGEVTNMFNKKELGTKVPAINIIETGESFIVQVAAPGLSKQDFAIGLDEEALTIAADIKMTEEEKQRKYIQTEFDFRSFKRSFAVPEAVEKEGIKAAYQEGLLIITLPKKESAKKLPGKKIEIW